MGKKKTGIYIHHCMECSNRFVATTDKQKFEMWCDGYGKLTGEKDSKFPNIPDWCPLEDE